MENYLLNILPHKPLNYQISFKHSLSKGPVLFSSSGIWVCMLSSYFLYNHKQTSTPIHSLFIFLEYPPNNRGYKCFDLSSRKIIINLYVIFYKTHFPFAKLHTPQNHTYKFLYDEPSPYLVHHFTTSPNPQVTPLPNALEPTSPSLASGFSLPSEQHDLPQPAGQIRSTPYTRPPHSLSLPTPISLSSPFSRSQHGIYKPKKSLTFLHQFLNPFYLITLCLLFVIRIGKRL